MVTWEVSNFRAMSVTNTRPSRSRISIMARRRSSLSTFSPKPGLMNALSFYIVYFRLSSRKGEEAGTGGKLRQQEVSAILRCLEFESQPNAVSSWRCDTGAGEKPGEIDHVNPVVEILYVCLQAYEQVFPPHQFGANRTSERKGRPHPAAIKVHAIDYLLPELLNCILDGAIELGRQAAPVSSPQRHPCARHNLIAKARADRISLVLRDRKAARIRQRIGSVIPDEQAASHGRVAEAHHVGIADLTGKASPVWK